MNEHSQIDPQAGRDGSAEKKKPRGKPFTGNGDPRSRQNLEKAGARKEPLSEESEGMLPAMQHVVQRPASADRTYEQREYRKWLKKDRKGFMTKLADLEKVALGAGCRRGRQGEATAPPADQQEVDEGSRRAEELCERLLAELAEEARAEAQKIRLANLVEEGGEVIASFKNDSDADLFRAAM